MVIDIAKLDLSPRLAGSSHHALHMSFIHNLEEHLSGGADLLGLEK